MVGLSVAMESITLTDRSPHIFHHQLLYLQQIDLPFFQQTCCLPHVQVSEVFQTLCISGFVITMSLLIDQGAAPKCSVCLLSDLFSQEFCTKTLLVSLTLLTLFIWAHTLHLASLSFSHPV